MPYDYANQTCFEILQDLDARATVLAGGTPGDTTAPVFTSGNPSGSYVEGAVISGTLTATDASPPITFGVTGADASAVTLNPTSGVWQLESTVFATKASYAFSFTATDSAAAPNVRSQAVNITITEAGSSSPIMLVIVENGQSLSDGNNSVADLTSEYQIVAPFFKLAQDALAGQFESLAVVLAGNTISGVTGPSHEYQFEGSDGVSSMTGTALAMGPTYWANVDEVLADKASVNGSPIETTAPEGNGWNKSDFILVNTIGPAVEARGLARIPHVALAQGEKEAQNSVNEAAAANGNSTDQAVVLPVALGANDPANPGSPNPVWLWAGKVDNYFRAKWEYFGFDYKTDGVLQIIEPFVLPVLGTAYSSLQERAREAICQEAQNISGRIAVFDGTNVTITTRANNRVATTWDTVNDQPIFTPTGQPDPYYNADRVTIIYRKNGTGNDASADRTHWSGIAAVEVGRLAIAGVHKHIYGGDGTPPSTMNFTHIKPVFTVSPFVVGSPGDTSVTIGLTPSESGTAHIAAYAAGSDPTPADIIAGTGAGFIAKTTEPVVRRQARTKLLAGLATGTATSVYCALVVGSKESVRSQPVNFTTGSGTPTPTPSNSPSVVAGGAAGGGGSLTLNYTAAEGDWAYLLVATSDEPVAVPSGFTEVNSISTGNPGTTSSSAVARLQVMRKLIGAGDPGSVTVADGGSSQCASVLIVSGADATEPLDASVTANSNGVTGQVVTAGTGAMIFPAVNSTVADTRVIMAIGTSADPAGAAEILSNFTNTTMGNFAVLETVQTDAGNGSGLYIVTGTLASAGSSGTATADLSINTGYAAISMALQP